MNDPMEVDLDAGNVVANEVVEREFTKKLFRPGTFKIKLKLLLIFKNITI